MLTATSPTRLKDDNPYRVPLALGLLFSVVFTLFLFLFDGFFVVVLGGLVFGLVVVLAGFGFAVVDLGLAVAFSFDALDSVATFSDTIWLGSSTTTFFSSATVLFSSIFSGIVSFSFFLSVTPPRAEFFFLVEVFLKFIYYYEMKIFKNKLLV